MFFVRQLARAVAFILAFGRRVVRATWRVAVAVLATYLAIIAVGNLVFATKRDEAHR